MRKQDFRRTKYFLRKLKDIKHKYGEKASDYLKQNPICEDCGEARLLVINIHHVDGKNVENFKTLCHNCHMIEHNEELSEYTYQTYLEEVGKDIEVERERDERILNRLNEGLALHKIIKEENTSLPSIKKVMKENGFVSMPQKGYKKIIPQ